MPARFATSSRLILAPAILHSAMLPSAMLLGLLLTAPAAQASSDDAWEEFRQEVETTCRTAAAGLLDVKSVQVDPFGSETYGFAVLVGIENGTTSERLVVCAFDKAARKAEISGTFER